MDLSSTTTTSVPLPPLSTPDSFPFPYPKPYDIQLQLMRTVFQAIEERKIAVVESPTGTGKSLTLLTSTLTWLAANQRRMDEAAEVALRERMKEEDPDEPAWVLEAAVKARLADLRAASDARAERLAKARASERKLRLQAGPGAAFRSGTKRAKVGIEVEGQGGRSAKEGDEEFLPDDADGGGGAEEYGANLSKEVRELMSRYESSRRKPYDAEEIEEDVPKIYYTSRTHTQLRQLTAELLKTSFPAGPTSAKPNLLSSAPNSPDLPEPGVSLVPLGSRKQLCINEKVRALARGGDERLNEACLDMQKAGSGKRCEFLPGKGEEARMIDARDAVLATVRDIEDIVAVGKATCVCPYYATRRAVKQAQLVTLPYNLLLQNNAREALEINLKDQIVVIDEAHNLIDTLLSIHSTTLTSSQLSNASSQLQQYLHRFRSRLKPVHALWIRQTLSVVQGLVKVCDQFIAEQKDTQGARTKGKGQMLDANTLIARVGGGSDQVNLREMVAYLKESKLARKVSSFAERTAEEATKQAAHGSRPSVSVAARHSSIAAFHQVEAFLLSLTDARDDGRVILAMDEPSGTKPGKPVVTLKYILLNPSERFREVVEQARCVVLAGGTMEPISDFMRQLFPSIPRDRFSTLSCAHIIPKDNLLTQVVSQGPRKVPFEFKYANREDNSLISELGAVIQSVIGLVPDGVVVFLPSYAFLDKVKAFWGGTGLLQKLGERKQTSGDVEDILRDYSLAISSAQAASAADTQKRKTGALLFAVVGGKLSEGINFSDSLGRCVIMVGLPFANVGSVELQERMRYVEKLPGAGKDAAKELYENLCMRAVNQSIGRAIRHANDYACILLVDQRYASTRIRSKLPKWIGEDVRLPGEYAGVARSIAGFFREKRERGLS